MTGRPPAATTLPICSVLSPRSTRANQDHAPLGSQFLQKTPAEGRGESALSRLALVRLTGPAAPSAASSLSIHARSHADARWPSHPGHGRDLVELVPIQSGKFIHLEQPVFHQAGEDEQESCEAEIEATFYFVALNA